MIDYNRISLLKKEYFSGKGFFSKKINIFFSNLAKARGINYYFFFFIMLVLKIPIILKYKYKNRLLKKSNLNTYQKNIYRNLERFGFSIKKDFYFDKKILEDIVDNFYKQFENTINAKNNEPMIYGALNRTHIDYILDFMNTKYLNVISKYLYGMPYLKTICYMYSKNQKTISNSSQFWHLDKQGPRTLKIFVALHDINFSNGPLTFLDAFKTKYLVNLLNYTKTKEFKRISDESIVEELYNIDILSEKFVGGKGSVAFLDTDRCLHFGSRKSNKPRLILYLEYGSLFDYTIPNF